MRSQPKASGWNEVITTGPEDPVGMQRGLALGPQPFSPLADTA